MLYALCFNFAWCFCTVYTVSNVSFHVIFASTDVPKLSITKELRGIKTMKRYVSTRFKRVFMLSTTKLIA